MLHLDFLSCTWQLYLEEKDTWKINQGAIKTSRCYKKLSSKLEKYLCVQMLAVK